MSSFLFDERAIFILQKIQQSKFKSWFVGGCVRDFLLGKPVIDYDIATNAHPDDIILIFKKDFKLDLKGRQFGSVHINNNGLWVEVTALRKDIAFDGRHAHVEFTDDLTEDAKRRDFTINALYCDIREDSTLNIIDFFQGKLDIENKKVRFIGCANDRVQEDYLRILRFFRFSAIYADTLDQNGLDACVNYQEGLQYLSGNRVWSEWKKILFAQNTQQVLNVIKINDIDITLFSGKIDTQIYAKYKGNDPLLLTSLLLPTVPIEHLVHRLSLSNSQKKWLETAALLKADHDFRSDYINYGHFTKELVWYWACKYKKNGNEVFKLPFWDAQNPIFPLSGKDLLKLGCQPGPIIGDYLQCAQKWWAQNNFKPSHKDCLLYVKSLFNK